nr:flavodoxin-dependent (E)-4-hydroxy-3-methylbut-2-enyl-diphosphate synthase [Desulfobacterales bacterium]
MTLPLQVKRRKSIPLKIGPVTVGGDAPISVQSMTNTPTQDVDATVAQIQRLEAAGCEIIRVAVPDEAAADAIARIKSRITIPLIADIHFDHRLAIRAARAGADALRLNPGNIGGAARGRAVGDCARGHGIALRVGGN